MRKRHDPHTSNACAGFTFIDVIIASSLMLIAFAGLFGALQASIKLVSTTKSKAGAIALANEQLEILRSLPYDDIGTVSGIPPGTIPQNSTTTINGVNYGIRTLIQYVDAPQDGVGGADANSITADYKTAKVEVTWSTREIDQSYALITNIVPRGIETISGGGTLTVNVFDALGAPVESADVRIVNDTTTSTIDVVSQSNTSGIVTFPGAPAASNYEIYVDKTGYSRAQTYTATTSNPNPNPGHVSVIEGDTTTVSFSIDELSGKTVNTFEPVRDTTFSDTFTSGANLSSTSPNIFVGGSQVELLNSGGYSLATGTAESIAITSSYLQTWEEFRFVYDEPASTTVKLHLYHDNGGPNPVIISDTDIPGNNAGFTVSPVDISGLSTTTYEELIVHVELKTNDDTVTPAALEWEVDYTEGPVPLPNIDFVLQGTKTIGTDGGGAPIYKVLENLSTDGSGVYATTTLEWDTYSIDIDDSATGYDVAEICEPEPIQVVPNTVVDTDILLVPDTNHTLLVSVRDDTGALLPNASVRLYRPGYDEMLTTSACGQVFFSDVPVGTVALGNTYTIETTATGFTMDTQNLFEINGVTEAEIILFP